MKQKSIPITTSVTMLLVSLLPILYFNASIITTTRQLAAIGVRMGKIPRAKGKVIPNAPVMCEKATSFTILEE